MSEELLDENQLDNHRPWKRLGKSELDRHVKKSSSMPDSSKPGIIRSTFSGISIAMANVFLHAVHAASRITNKPVVDIGQTYSVSTLYDRIEQLEEVLVRQWSHSQDGDHLAPSEEVGLYLAACHVARQYDRITLELLTSRLGVSQNKAASLLEQMMDDEIITESYTMTYHDVRRAAIDTAIEHKLGGLHKNLADERSAVAPGSSSQTKKH